uniref:SUN domain-containing protein n=1 Tax=Knipowitschia caucasica TaxID=637954 RepID=A0AAV2M4E1_KNICA
MAKSVVEFKKSCSNPNPFPARSSPSSNTCLVQSRLNLSVHSDVVEAGHLYHKADQDLYSGLLYKEGNQGPNYASLENGANFIISQTFSTCQSPTWREWARTWFFLRQHHILQSCSPLRPGVCWPMAGDKGYVTIQPSQGIRVRHVTIGHIRKIQSPTKDTPSAPRDMALYGLKWEDSKEEFLGSFIYDQNGLSFQTFGLQHTDPETVQQGRRHIDSNYGNKDFTSLYKGLKWEDSEEEFLGSFIYDQNGLSFQTFGLQHTDPETVQQVRLHINNLRRSGRLQQQGYYSSEGHPSICYKETPYK